LIKEIISIEVECLDMKVMTIVGTRPEIIKLSRVISQLAQSVEHTLVHTGQNDDFELNDIFFNELGITRPQHILNARGRSAIETIANVLQRTDEILEQVKPDAVLILGDTNSAMSAICAKRRKIPIFHMEAGNRCFDDRVPEEINRRIIDHISDINLVYTEHARRNLLAEGIATDRIFKTGSPQKEVLDFYGPQIAASSVLARLGVTAKKYFLVSLHREENVDQPENLRVFVGALNQVVREYGLPILFSVHPRTKLRLDALGEKLDPQVTTLKPLGFPDYVKLQREAFCVLSDSGTITEEASLLGFPAINLREAHERPEGVDEGVLVMTGIDQTRILDAISLTRRQVSENWTPSTPSDYLVENTSWKVTKAILSYTDYVNRTVWLK
jgi:UDP-N-acetylglucosamine 2-epimerase (non-hydrolysing)